MVVWDTAGQERYRSITKAYYKGAHGIMIVFSLTDRHSFDNLDHWLRQIDEIADKNLVKLLVGNKCDSLDRVINFEEIQSFCLRNNLIYLEASALIDRNVHEIFYYFLERCFEKYIEEPKTKEDNSGQKLKSKTNENQSLCC